MLCTRLYKSETTYGIKIAKSNPQQIPVINIAAPNIPAIPLYFGSTQLEKKIKIHFKYFFIIIVDV